jgi:hypothetical protein
MDSIEITTELHKIQNIHSSLNETNPQTYIIFQETFRHKLSMKQHEWLDTKINDLVNKEQTKVESLSEIIDLDIASLSLLEKMDNNPELRVISRNIED